MEGRFFPFRKQSFCRYLFMCFTFFSEPQTVERHVVMMKKGFLWTYVPPQGLAHINVITTMLREMESCHISRILSPIFFLGFTVVSTLGKIVQTLYFIEMPQCAKITLLLVQVGYCFF